jgi:hypothetical protein
MKKLFFLMIFLSFINCEKDGSPEDKIFTAQKLPQLNLQYVGNFWDDDSIKQISDYMGALFENHLGFIDGVRYDGVNKNIGISVFRSQTEAIQALEGRINTVACVIQQGANNDILKGKWWFSDCIPNIVFVNQHNTIAEVSYYIADYEQVKTLLMETAAEIARRVDFLSK